MTLLSLAIILAYALFIEWLWGWRKLLALWAEAGWQALIAALLLLLCTHLLRAWRISDYFPQQTRGRFGALFRLMQLHNLLNIMLPLRTGEASFPLLMRREFSLPLARSVSALLVMRLLDLHALLAAAGAGLALQSGAAWAFLLWVAFVLLPLPAFALRNRFLSLAEAVAPQRLRALLEEVRAGLPGDAPAFLRAWGATLVNWFTKVAVLAWILALMAGLSPGAALGGALGGEISSVLPLHAPGGAGTYPAGIVAGALAFGAEASGPQFSRLAWAAVNTHLLVVVSALVGTALSLLLPRRRR